MSADNEQEIQKVRWHSKKTVCLVCPVCLIFWLNETNQINQIH